MKAEADSLGIDLLRLVEKSKKLEKLVMVLFFYADARIHYLDLYHSVALRILKVMDVLFVVKVRNFSDVFTLDFHEPSSLSELYSVGEQI